MRCFSNERHSTCHIDFISVERLDKHEMTVCEHGSGLIQCAPGQCVKVHRAWFGRWDDSTCPGELQPGAPYLQLSDKCEVDVTKMVKGW